MTYTYDPTQLAASELMQVRFEIDDTDSNDPKLQDEEITFAISRERNYWGAAAHCAEVLSRRYLAQADVQLGRNLRIQYSQHAAQYAEMAKLLRQKSLGSIVPFVGGTSISEKEDARADADTVQPLFTKKMFENPRTGGLSSDPLDRDAQP